MGMFDTYIPKPDLHCPRCGDALSNWQSKDGPCCLLTYAFGDEIEESDDDDYRWSFRDRPAPDRIEIYTTCEHDHWIDAECRLEKRRWVETTITGSRDLPPKVPWPPEA